MPNITAKTSSNIFYKARCAASMHNEQLKSREGAADIMLINRGRLYRIEKGVSEPYSEEVKLMADLYNAPELENYYCTKICPLGYNIPEIDTEDLDRIAIRALAQFRKMKSTAEELLAITEDGEITEDEEPTLENILNTLGELEKIRQSLKIWVKKNL